MSTKKKPFRMYVRPIPEALHAMQTMHVALQAPHLFGPDLTQEDFVTSTWLWMAKLTSAELAEHIGPYLRVIREAKAARETEGSVETSYEDQQGNQLSSALAKRKSRQSRKRKEAE